MAVNHNGESRILILGHDHGLLMTRQLLLERDGARVFAVNTIREFRESVLKEAFDLVLLCQSLSADECESAAQFSQEHAPSTRLLLMFTRVGKCIPDNADVLLDSLAGPKAFIETTRRMLGNGTSYTV